MAGQDKIAFGLPTLKVERKHNAADRLWLAGMAMHGLIVAGHGIHNLPKQALSIADDMLEALDD